MLRFGECTHGFLRNNMSVAMMVANNMHHEPYVLQSILWIVAPY